MMSGNPLIAAGAGIGAGILGRGLFPNPADAAMGPMNKIPDYLKQYFNPYIEAGNRALPGLEGQYGQLINDPGGRINQIGAGYQQSPGFKFALQQALQGAGHAAAAGGMAGSPEHEQQNMGLATNLANQDYYHWLDQAMGAYGMGLQGEQGLYNTGARAGMGLGENLAQSALSKAMMKYAGQANQNQMTGGLIGDAIGMFL